jgi:hypothetical protein
MQQNSRPNETFPNKLVLYGEKLLAPWLNPELNDHPLSTAHDCLFSMSAAMLHIWRQLGDAPCRVDKWST